MKRKDFAKVLASDVEKENWILVEHNMMLCKNDRKVQIGINKLFGNHGLDASSIDLYYDNNYIGGLSCLDDSVRKNVKKIIAKFDEYSNTVKVKTENEFEKHLSKISEMMSRGNKNMSTDKPRKTDPIIAQTEWMIVKRTEGGYEYKHHPGIGALLYRQNDDGSRDFLLRNEYCPLVMTDDNNMFITIITGMIDEGYDPMSTVIKEVAEEAGYTVDESNVTEMGSIFVGKDRWPYHQLYLVDVTGLKEGEIVGDGSENERKSYNFWVSYETLIASARTTECVFLKSAVLNYGGM